MVLAYLDRMALRYSALRHREAYDRRLLVLAEAPQRVTDR
jgi:hypothetical protein